MTIINKKFTKKVVIILAIKVAQAILKYGSKAWAAIKKGAASVYNSAKAAWDKGYWAFIKWISGAGGALELIYYALKAAGLID